MESPEIFHPSINPYFMKYASIKLDPRWFQIAFQALFLGYGIAVLHWAPSVTHYLLSILGCLAATWLAECYRQQRLVHVLRNRIFRSAAFSVLISAASLCLLLKTNHWWVSLLAAGLTVASKYFLRVGSKHIFNPSAFGIVAAVLLTGQAWISPGQWGNQAVMFFAIITLGTIVVTRVQKLDVSLAFLITFAGLIFWRQILVLGWPMDYFVHSVTTGGLLLFTFFMISDPRTTPNHPLARIVWAVLIAVAAFYLSAFKFMNSMPVWILVAAAPLVPVLDRFFKAKVFQWQAVPVPLLNAPPHPTLSRISGIIVLVGLVAYEAAAFCGFYVSKADGTLTNKTSQVIMVRDGEKNVITMFNDFKGNIKEFAMVVPVPVILKKTDIRVVDQQVFQTLNDYSKPRLVEYNDENPCEQRVYDDVRVMRYYAAPMSMSGARSSGIKYKVKVEARYVVGEYDILILSATESSALKTWLHQNGYKIPANAEEVLEPYIRSNLKFFVVKVNEEEKKKLPGNFLRPIQISFNSPKFMLPIRLGMANADGDQDLIVYAFTKRGRVELTNYRTVSMPTGNNIPEVVQNNFSAFYTNTFKRQWEREGKSVGFLEYAWDVSPRNYVKCDPCVGTAPNQQDLVQAGVWWMKEQEQGNDDTYRRDNGDNGAVFFSRLHLRYNRRSFPQDLMFQLTPNTQSFQARYVIHHPAKGSLDCDAAKAYKEELRQRRLQEFANLRALTGKGLEDWDLVGRR